MNSAVEHLMKFGGLAKSTARKYVCRAVRTKAKAADKEIAGLQRQIAETGPTPAPLASTAAASPKAKAPAELHQVNARIDRFAGFFREKSPQVAEWMDKLKAHVNDVGVASALEALGTERTGGDKSATQYQGGWESMGDFAKDYLERQGISLMMDDNFDPGTKILSSMSPSQGMFVRGKDGDFFPADPTLKDKLQEAKALPGLEKSEDLNVVMGIPDKKVTHLTDDVIGKLNKDYGEGKWIVKAYGDDAAAGYGIFFPQKAAKVKQDAQNTIWTAGSEVARYGFSLRRDEAGKVIGLEHSGGDRYDFGTDKYNHVIHGDVRAWGDRAAAAAAHEHGAELPGEGKDFMAQPAFPVVGVSDADRAAGRTHEGTGEGRVHLVTRGGKVEIIPHSTWIKGEHLPVVFESDDTRAMAKAAQDAISLSPSRSVRVRYTPRTSSRRRTGIAWSRPTRPTKPGRRATWGTRLI